jgi:hypothetical protein
MTFNQEFRTRPNLAQYVVAAGAGEETWKLPFKFKYGGRPPEAPFKPSRFDSADLMNRAQTSKPTLNPRLGLKPFEDLFAGIGKFNRADYDFETGVSATSSSPVDDPEFSGEFAELYNFSPVIPPEKKISNPMPTAFNPDPKGFLAAMGEAKLKTLLDKPPSTEEQAAKREDSLEQLDNAEA